MEKRSERARRWVVQNVRQELDLWESEGDAEMVPFIAEGRALLAQMAERGEEMDWPALEEYSADQVIRTWRNLARNEQGVR